MKNTETTDFIKKMSAWFDRMTVAENSRMRKIYYTRDDGHSHVICLSCRFIEQRPLSVGFVSWRNRISGLSFETVTSKIICWKVTLRKVIRNLRNSVIFTGILFFDSVSTLLRPFFVAPVLCRWVGRFWPIMRLGLGHAFGNELVRFSGIGNS